MGGLFPGFPVRGLRPEAQLLLALSRLRLNEEQQESIHGFIEGQASRLDWGYFLDQACRHAVLPLVGRNLIRLRLTQSDEGRPLAPYRWIYSYVYEGNRRRNTALADEYAKVLRSFNRLGIRYAIRKGPLLSDGVYHDIGVRRMADLDVVVSRAQLPDFEKAVTAIGYAQGHQSRNGETVVPYSRETQLYWRMSVQNALPYIKIANRDEVEVFVLDACLSLFQTLSGNETPIEEFLDRVVPVEIYGEPSYALSPADQFVDLCLHLHKEAVGLHYIQAGKDLTILKFLDIVEMLGTLDPGSRSRLPELGAAYRCTESLYFALHHAALLYPDAVPVDLLEQLRPGDTAFLDEYGQLDGHRSRWDRPFLERLFDPSRSASLTVASSVPWS